MTQRTRRLDSPATMTLDEPPSGSDWIPWRSASNPTIRLWVNETDREIDIVESGERHRFRASDPTTFALDVADLERLYDAVPSVGSRDSCALLAEPRESITRCPPGPRTESPAASGTDAMMVLRSQLWLELLAALALLRHALVALAGPALGVMTLVGVIAGVLWLNADSRASWISWAQQFGSAELRAAVADAPGLDELPPGLQDHPERTAALRFESLLRADVALAITPPVPGADRCSGSVQLGRAIKLPGLEAQHELAAIRANVASSAATLPQRSTVDVGELTECSTSESGLVGECVPVSLRKGQFQVQSCYRLKPPRHPGHAP